MSVAAGSPSTGPKKRIARLTPSGLILTTVACTALMIWGALIRGHSDLVAEEGLGYWLGIMGLSMMALLLTYSLRKRMPKLLGRYSIRRWFEIHMMLGLAGPTAILYHCNFHLGSLNSTVALVSMVLVAASGVAGRFMYTRIHHGLLGDRATVEELHEHIASERVGLGRMEIHNDRAATSLAEFEAYALARRKNPLSSTIRFLTLSWHAAMAGRACRISIPKETPAQERRAYGAAVHEYVKAVRRAGEFSTFAWLFSLWHALHLPLCVLLFAAAGVHVLAVNLY